MQRRMSSVFTTTFNEKILIIPRFRFTQRRSFILQLRTPRANRRLLDRVCSPPYQLARTKPAERLSKTIDNGRVLLPAVRRRNARLPDSNGSLKTRLSPVYQIYSYFPAEGPSRSRPIMPIMKGHTQVSIPCFRRPGLPLTRKLFDGNRRPSTTRMQKPAR